MQHLPCIITLRARGSVFVANFKSEAQEGLLLTQLRSVWPSVNHSFTVEREMACLPSSVRGD